MILFGLSGLLVGALVGVRFTVLGLIPVLIYVLVLAGASPSAKGNGLGSTVVELALFVACLQIGYLCGAVVSLGLLSPRALRPGNRPAQEQALPETHLH